MFDQEQRDREDTEDEPSNASLHAKGIPSGRLSAKKRPAEGA